MKILWRTLIILLAVAVVTGATLGAMQLPAVQTWIGSQGGEQHGPPSNLTAGTFTEDEAADSAAAVTGSDETTATAAETSAATTGEQTRPVRGEGGGHNSGGNLIGLVEVAKNLVIVLAVSLVIAAASWAARRLRPRRHLPAAAA